jgi:hypothetical protein
MIIKTINDLVGPNGIILILLVFSAYPQLTKIDLSSLLVTKKTEAICAATKEVRCLYAKRQVKDALAIYNSPDTKNTLDLPLQLNVRVWRKKKEWTRPYKLFTIKKETYIINMSQRPAKFQSTVIKLYLTEQPCQKKLKVPKRH